MVHPVNRIPLIGILLLSGAFPCFALEIEPQGTRDFLTEQPMLLGAHRGGKHEWPENTLVALREAARRWPDIVLELDVHATADGHAVVIHDFDVDRTTNGSGFVAMMPLEEVQALDAAWHFTTDGGETFPYRGRGVTIPTLEEALNAAPGHRFLIEMKDGANIAEATANAISRAGAVHRCIVASVSPVFLESFSAIAPEIATSYDFLSASDMLSALRGGDWDQYTARHRMLALSPPLKERFGLVPEEIARIRQKGVLVSFFTINNRHEMERLIKLGADNILTDRPSLLAEVIENLSRPDDDTVAAM